MLARRRRSRNIGSEIEKRALAEFEDDIVNGFLEVHPLEDKHAINARALLANLATASLRTLDALHLAIATDIAADGVATADKNFAEAARALGLRVEWFGQK